MNTKKTNKNAKKRIIDAPLLTLLLATAACSNHDETAGLLTAGEAIGDNTGIGIGEESRSPVQGGGTPGIGIPSIGIAPALEFIEIKPADIVAAPDTFVLNDIFQSAPKTIDLTNTASLLIAELELNQALRIEDLSPFNNSTLIYGGELYSLFTDNTNNPTALLAARQGDYIVDANDIPIVNDTSPLDINGNNIYILNAEDQDLVAGDGNDFIIPGGGLTSINGGGGIDVVSYSELETSIEVLWAEGDIYGVRYDSRIVDALIDIEKIIGTSGLDTISYLNDPTDRIIDFRSDSPNNKFVNFEYAIGGSGNDILINNEFNNIFVGSVGKDTYYIDDGDNVVLDFQVGEDSIGIIDKRQFINDETAEAVVITDPIHDILKKLILADIIELSVNAYYGAEGIQLDFSNDAGATIEVSVNGKDTKVQYNVDKDFSIHLRPTFALPRIDEIEPTEGATASEIDTIYDAFLTAIGGEAQLQFFDV